MCCEVALVDSHCRAEAGRNHATAQPMKAGSAGGHQWQLSLGLGVLSVLSKRGLEG